MPCLIGTIRADDSSMKTSRFGVQALPPAAAARHVRAIFLLAGANAFF
jgi:hypothetical protein